MCGIVGLFRPGGLSEPAAVENTVREAASTIAYRGPDAAGVKLLPSDGLAFGHRRLSILDLDPRANQPMTSSDGQVLITYNGEIYNFRELRENLAGDGASFRTESDTEVLLHLCDDLGAELLGAGIDRCGDLLIQQSLQVCAELVQVRWPRYADAPGHESDAEDDQDDRSHARDSVEERPTPRLPAPIWPLRHETVDIRPMALIEEARPVGDVFQFMALDALFIPGDLSL